jgi:mannose-6-phosphate isomerase-like protein (cupin superfamily)
MSKARRVEKPWGYELIWAENEKYVGKILYIKEGHRLSRQYHEEKDETIFVLSGVLLVELGEGDDDTLKFTLTEGKSERIVPGTIHRFCANCGSDVKLIEVSTPELDDVVRIEDDYER